MIAWPCPAPGGSGEEFAVVAGPEDARNRVLIVPALFEEANRTRRLLAQTMRLLATRGIAGVLPDLPGCGESLAPLDHQDLSSWRAATAAAAKHFTASHVLALRGGALIAPAELRGWRFEAGANVLRPLLRARIVAAREEGRTETVETLLALGCEHGLELAGYRLGPQMIADLEQADLPEATGQAAWSRDELGGEALWLRSEPGEDPALAVALAQRIAADIDA